MGRMMNEIAVTLIFVDDHDPAAIGNISIDERKPRRFAVVVRITEAPRMTENHVIDILRSQT